MSLLKSILTGGTVCDPDPLSPDYFEKYTPARDLLKTVRRRILREYPSVRMRRNFVCESGLEREKLKSVGIDPTVDSYVTQPTTVHYQHEGKILRYTPDGLLQRVNRKREIYEVRQYCQKQSAGIAWQSLIGFGRRMQFLSSLGPFHSFAHFSLTTASLTAPGTLKLP